MAEEKNQAPPPPVPPKIEPSIGVITITRKLNDDGLAEVSIAIDNIPNPFEVVGIMEQVKILIFNNGMLNSKKPSFGYNPNKKFDA